MKPFDYLSMEAVFILTGIGILVIGGLSGALVSWLMIRAEKKGKENK